MCIVHSASLLMVLFEPHNNSQGWKTLELHHYQPCDNPSGGRRQISRLFMEHDTSRPGTLVLRGDLKKKLFY